MYMHLGDDYTVFLNEVIAIVNIDGLIDRSVKDIIDLAQAEKKLCRIGEKGKEKSLIITEQYVYLSPISSLTLFKRGHSFLGGGLLV
ncbi:MAG TPA: DUF370 domain-containing protein [Syntrophothermus lipocalidus]|uniref:DUF370 domain-containing protein n=1 Tax=Syntrophothermus lipocalidus (strain DSM 12680 / TGB-C1) TaxID=643648 RepID=D7CPP0_SYNLT|nr:extracellular matrix/biofilm biosynthesis regulator RemA family protein [Syntrophothermus lipocalidus]ADI00812.1 conserved hypothetical protein [Syntrophothermus lipocalidus DSM 12680]HHV76605.1 DUF370 domain-containing protein [Syntrophothermus lipocalidus]